MLKFYSNKDISSTYSNKFFDDLLKREMVVSKMKLALQKFFTIYKNNFNNSLHSNFMQWKLKAFLLQKQKKFETGIKQELLNKFLNKKKEISSQISQKEKNIKKFKEEIKTLNEQIVHYKKNIKENDEKENSYNKRIKELEEENSKMEIEIKKSNGLDTNDSDKDSKKSKMENNIIELDSKIKRLEEEMKEKETFCSSQFKEFNEMLDFFEQKAAELERMKLMNQHQSSSKDNTANNTVSSNNPNPYHQQGN